jgi:hypothetical protein
MERRGRFQNVLWKQGRHNRMRFSTHFHANSEEFNQLVQTDYLKLGGNPTLPQPPVPPNSPL